MRLILFVTCIACSMMSFAQTDSNTVVRKKTPEQTKHKSPATATWLALALPGAGHVYNGRSWWWKVPIIYGAGASLVYGIVFYNRNYNDFKNAYSYRIDNNTDVNNDPRFDRYQTGTLLNLRDAYKNDRDMCIIGLALLYSLQALDACVEAHFLEFTISDNLSLQVNPYVQPIGLQTHTGIICTFNLK